MKYVLDNLVIEITRRCNMACDHCLRGDSQAKDIDLDHIRTLFKHVDRINTLTLTGGEPSLVPHIIEGITTQARVHGIDIDRFYLATNAKEVSDAFFKAVLNLYLYCDNSEPCCGSVLDYSNDGHHEDVDPDNIKKLMVFRFTSKKNTEDGVRYDDPKWDQIPAIIMEGRGKDFYGRNLLLCPFEIMDEYIQNTEFYLNVNGDIVGACDLSYESQDVLKVDNVNARGFTPLRAAKRWNKRLEAFERPTVSNLLEAA